MHARSLLAASLGLAASVVAFKDTTPLLAFASSSSDCGSPIIFHAPGLKASDLSSLREERSAIRSAWDAATGGRISMPYVQPEQVGLALSKLGCRQGRDYEVVQVEGFEAGADRRSAARRLDQQVGDRLDAIDGEHLMIFVSHPLDAHKLQRRQYSLDDLPSRPALSILQGSGNSSWKPDPTAPALAKYTIISPIQVFIVLIFVFILLPASVWTIGLLSSTIEIPYGLQKGMKGPSMDQKRKDQ